MDLGFVLFNTHQEHLTFQYNGYDIESLRLVSTLQLDRQIFDRHQKTKQI